MKYFITYVATGKWKRNLPKGEMGHTGWGYYDYENSLFYEGELDKELIIKAILTNEGEIVNYKLDRDLSLNILGSPKVMCYYETIDINLKTITKL